MKRLFILTIAFILTVGCGQKPNHSETTHDSLSDLKVGGLYVIKDKDGSYFACKILVLDSDAVHLRTYRNIFQVKPTQLSSDSLQIMIGHAPLDTEGFLQDNPELIQIEEVKDSELEGYRMYLEG